MSEDNNNMYSVTGEYFPPQLYHRTTNAESPQVVLVRATETPQRKRKYTRSKTGCMTCRVKKVKCDERKPVCSRCIHGVRECSWPEGVQTRKRTPKRDSVDESLFTSELVAESPGLSESPSSSGREQTPPYRSLADLVPISPRSSNSYESTHSMSPDPNTRPIYPQRQHSYSFPVTSANHYTTRYDHSYPDPQTVPCGMPPTSIRQQHLPQANPSYWNSELDTYYYNHRVSLQENMLPGQPSSLHDHPHHRFYQ